MDPTSPASATADDVDDVDEAAARPQLAARIVASSGPDQGRLVLVHGFTQTAVCWAPVDTMLSPDHELVLIDAPGHGRSAAVELDLVSGGSAIAEVGGSGTYLGYSMGSRFVLHTALERPDHVRRLVLISPTAGIEDDTERAARRQSDDTLAAHLVAVGVPAFVDEWLRRPLFAGLPPDRAHRTGRLANTAAGLASSLHRAGTGTQTPLWDRLTELAMPVLIVAGADDAKFVTLAERMAAAIGLNAELCVIESAGHTVHLEQPAAFLDRLRSWLTRTA